MAKYLLKSPAGDEYDVEAPDDASEEQVLSYFQQQLGQPKSNAEPPVSIPSSDPTKGMGGFQKFAAGAVSSFAREARGLEQKSAKIASMHLPGPFGTAQGLAERLRQAITDRTPGVIQSDIDEARRLDAPLMKTGEGQLGAVAGNTALALPTAFIPGANTYLGSTLIGSALGALEPVATGESQARNTVAGGAGGFLGQLGGRVISSVGSGIKAITEPFYKKGQENIAGRALSAFAGNADDAAAKMATAKEIIPGSAPTMAEASGDAGVSQLQRALQSQNPQLASDLAERALDQNSSRLAAMHELTKYGGNLDEALTRRAEAGAKLYEKAFGQKIRVDDAIKAIQSRPSFQKALERAQRIAEEEGAPIKNLFDQDGKFASTRAMHYVKMGFDDLINDAPQAGIGKTELNAIKSTRGKLLDWMSENNPAYNTARVRFEKMSRPINRQNVADEIVSRATRSQQPNARGEMTIYPDAFSRTLKDEGEAVTKAATGRAGKTLESVMTPKQMDVLRAIRGDLARSVTARDSGRAVGSNTAQNLASQNFLNQSLGPLGPLASRFAESPAARSTIGRVTSFAAKPLEGDIQNILGEAVLNPSYAAELMRTAMTKGRNFGTALPYLPTAIGTGVGRTN